MRFDVEVWLNRSTKVSDLLALNIFRRRIRGIARFAGSCHVRDMGGHYQDYIEPPARMPLIAVPPGLRVPAWTYYSPLDIKLRANGITGNIGEAIAAVVATARLSCTIRDIAHIKAVRRRRSPDYLMRFPSGLPREVQRRIPSGTFLPDWWPAESKARHDPDGTRTLEDAFLQLVAYWYSLLRVYPQGVGYGLVFNCIYNRSAPTIRVHYFLPSNVAGVQTVLAGFVNYKQLMIRIEANPRQLGDLLYGNW